MTSATIEPRLIALLNDPATDFAYSRIDLPPLQNSNILKVPQRPSPLEPDAGTRNAKQDELSSQQNGAFDREMLASDTLTGSSDVKESPTERALGGNSPHALRKILDDPQTASGAQQKKRQRSDTSKDEFVQLPQPPKKQRAVKQPVPPIIIGLYEPPPNAALFPPISSSSFHDSHGRNSLNTAPQNATKEDTGSNVRPKRIETPERSVTERQKPFVRPRKKWSEEETNYLLLGVQKHGIGNWTKILHDTDFKFDNRKAVDLKDRFRTCCPTELRTKQKRASTDIGSNESTPNKPKARTKSGLLFENILMSSTDESDEEKMESGSSSKPRKSRAHRKKMEDLAELGINEPFKKSRRRERKPFTEEEDRNILQGFQEFGALWTTIQKDPRFGLKNRRPTDLRDRLRNKYPERYFLEEDGKRPVKEDISPRAVSFPKPTPSSHNLEPSSNQERKPPGPIYNSFSELLGPSTNLELPDPLSFTQGLEWADTVAPFTSTMGDMDISRLLLDETWNPTFAENSIKQKPSYTDISSLLIQNASSSSGFTPLYNSAGIEPQHLGIQMSSAKGSEPNGN